MSKGDVFRVFFLNESERYLMTLLSGFIVRLQQTEFKDLTLLHRWLTHRSSALWITR